jgi:alginate O-acetyltransferase complex protein AlgI
MLLTAPSYYWFLGSVFFAFWLLRRFRLPGILAICTANLMFYAVWGWVYLLLMPAAAAIDFLLGRKLARTEQPAARRLLVSLSIALNIGLIVSSRYLPLLHLARAGVLLPLSLSYYAFQALTYTIDIFRGDTQPASDYVDYLASVTFFPTTLAGPITRVGSLLPQWKWKNVVLTGEEGGRALFLIGLGLAKKFLIADYLGNNLVNRVFDLPALYSGGDVLVGVYGYAFQLYYDFSGYTDIAVGSGLLLGIRLPVNFKWPYGASNIADFWRRWHISFSDWLRDYLYFSLPLGRTRAMPYVGLIVTMMVGGLWHGVSWTFLIWGVLHGTGLATFRLWQSLRRSQPEASAMGRAAGGLLTFHFVLLGWVFFRAASVGTAMTVLTQIGSGHYSFDNTTPLFLLVLGIAAAGHFLPKSWYDGSMLLFTRAPAMVQTAALAVLTVAIRYVASSGAAPFIYSKF